MHKSTLVLLITAWILFSVGTLIAAVKVPNIFCDHMVLQQGQQNKVWGLADPDESVTVQIDDQTHKVIASQEGAWSVMLEPLPLGGPYSLAISATNKILIKDVLVGEVWICSGQSNMAFRVDQTNDADLVKTAAHCPQIRMITYPKVGSQKPIWTHDKADWFVCSPETVGRFSAVGYFFGHQLHEALGVPIGLIDNSWGGSAADAWIDHDTLQANTDYQATLSRWQKTKQRYEELAALEKRSEKQKKSFQQLKNNLRGQQRPSNLYNGVLKSHLGYGIRGVIWYQGEANRKRAYQYRYLFPLMISSWREEWKQGDFPFYWVQLADFNAEQPEPSESEWAELREAQTMTMSNLNNTGQAVIIDVGEGKDIHPRNKETVGERLARWALAKDYGYNIACNSPIYNSMEQKKNSIILSFDHINKGWRPFDTKKIIGFAIAGADKKFIWADAKIIKDNRIEVSSSQVEKPVAVRYGWADNPKCNLYDEIGLPLTPFRTDDWPGLTVNER